MITSEINKFIKDEFGCSTEQFIRAIYDSPSSRGYIQGAVSELFLRDYLETKGYEVKRIKEKPGGGNKAKTVYGDFYVRKGDSGQDAWLIVESKGLKSNSEFRGAKLDNSDKALKYLTKLVFPARGAKIKAYQRGLATYNRARTKWERKHRGKRFPPFQWSREAPGPVMCDLSGIWANVEGLSKYIKSLRGEAFTEQAYRAREGAIAIIETHKPSRRVAAYTCITQAAPLVSDFSVLAVDLYLRTGKHEFVFANPKKISHSPTSPEHLYQNYTIDVLVPKLKDQPRIQKPWYTDFDECVRETKPTVVKEDTTQIDDRQNAD